jgi:phage shock protein E
MNGTQTRWPSEANDRTIRSMIRPALALAVIAALGITACGGDGDTSQDPASTPPPSSVEEAGIRVVSPDQAAATIADPPEDLVILDVRTQEEFDEGHVEGAMMLDFYRDDFADELATFDRDVPFVLYCRSGSRSSQARAIMGELGFTDVEDVDGGIAAWQEARLPVETG